MKSQQTRYSDDRMSELGDIQGSEVTRLFQAAQSDDDLLAMQRGVAFLVSQFTPEAVVEVGKSAEATAWARKTVRRMWAEYDRMGERGNLERQAEAERKLIRFPRPQRF
jgi:hypothetical protein